MDTQLQGMELCEELWNEYEPILRKLCDYKLSSHPSEVDDVIADAYLSLCNAIKKGEKLDSPRGWLFSTVNNLIKIKYTEINKHKKRYVNLESVERCLVYNINFGDIKLSYELEDELVEEIFNELTASEKTLLILIYKKELKYRQIAQILGKSEGAVKQKHYRLKRKVKQIAKEKIKNLE